MSSETILAWKLNGKPPKKTNESFNRAQSGVMVCEAMIIHSSPTGGNTFYPELSLPGNTASNP